jgi:hypothetical protein
MSCPEEQALSPEVEGLAPDFLMPSRAVVRLTTSMISQPSIRLSFWDSSVSMSQRRWLGGHFSKDVTYNCLVCYQRRPVTIFLAPASVDPGILSHL